MRSIEVRRVRTSFGRGRGSAPPPEPTLAEELATAVRNLMARSRVYLAFLHGHSRFRSGAWFEGVVINGPLAEGPAGCLKGPSLADSMDEYHDVQNLSGRELDIYEAIRDGTDASFESWRSKVTIPLLPLYSLFAAFPGPLAPPTPNTPVPLSSFVSARADQLLAPNLQLQMTLKLSPELRQPVVTPLLQSLSLNISSALIGWIGTQVVTGVMGKGPVPTFAPPYVPVGPVVGGSVIGEPPIGI
jgi:hypothetical protein